MKKEKRLIKRLIAFAIIVLMLAVTGTALAQNDEVTNDLEITNPIDKGSETTIAGKPGEMPEQPLAEQPPADGGIAPEDATELPKEDGKSDEEIGETEKTPENEASEETQPEKEKVEGEQKQEEEEKEAFSEEEALAKEEWPEAEVMNAPGYMLLEDGISAIVTDFAQLKDATEKDNGILNVYLGADIELLQNRTVIAASKPEFKLSGRNPVTGIRHTVTEYKTTGLANIVVATGNSTTKKVTMEDMNIINQGDYYGLIGVEDGAKGVEMVVRNVDFTGRQFAYNLYGSLVFEGTNNITIAQTTNGAAGQEVAEVLHVVVRGNLTVNMEASYHAFRMNTGAGTFTVEGSFTINAPNISSGNGIIQSLTGASAVSVVAAPGARVNIMSGSRLASGVLNSLTVGDGANFHYEKLGSDLNAAVSLRQTLSVGAGATFYAKNAGTGYLFWFYDVPGTMSGGEMQFTNPKQVTLINNGNAAMVYGIKNEELNIVTQYLHYWGRAQNPAADQPLYSFSKMETESKADISIKMVHRAGSPSSISTNHPGITKDTLKLDAVAKQIEFGQGARSTLKFSALHEETGQPVEDFNMEDMQVETGTETRVKPQEILGLIAVGYTVNGGGMQQLTGGEAAITPEDGEANIVFYYNEPVIDVSVPIKMMFAAYESDGGQVTSQAYSFKNNSSFNVDVALTAVTAMEEKDNVALAGGEGRVEGNKLSLSLAPIGSEGFNEVNLIENMNDEEYIGTLKGKNNTSGQVMNFTIEGTYFGSFEGKPKWPGYSLEFAFKMSREEKN